MAEKSLLRGVSDPRVGACADIQEVFDRLLRLEIVVEAHEEELKEYKEATKNLKTSLDAIEDTLMQIKWLAIGGAVMFLASEVGIIQVLKALIH